MIPKPAHFGALIAASLVATITLPASARTLDAAGSPLRLCESRTGALMVSNIGCPAGTRARAWQGGTVVPPGISRAVDARADGSALNTQDDEAAISPRPTGVDPFVACRDIGGRFHLVSRVCLLPTGRLKSPSQDD